MLAASLAAAASAATPLYWTPQHMAKALTALQYPHQGTLGGTCKGQSKARHGTYTAFKCRMAWQTVGTTTESGTATVWAKPMARGRLCGSTVSLRACRPLSAGPLASDPTICADNDPALCARAAAEQAVLAKYGRPQVNLVCKQGASLYAWSCTWLGGAATVTFAKGASAWSTVVTP